MQRKISNRKTKVRGTVFHRNACRSVSSTLFVSKTGSFFPESPSRCIPRRMTYGKDLPGVSRKALRNPWFPLTYLGRNLARYRRERGKGVPMRILRTQLWVLVVQRAAWFLALKASHNSVECSSNGNASKVSRSVLENIDAYCDHCGLCCEIAGGYGAFPREGKALPGTWKRLFAEGLGPGHWFCAFLLEKRSHGRSRCAIHACRPVPCRIFEKEECTALKKDVDREERTGAHIRAWSAVRIRRLLKGNSHRARRLVDGRPGSGMV